MATRAKRRKLLTRDWAGGLPTELLAGVAEHLTDTDHVRLAAVCTSWRAAIKDLHRRPAVLCPWIVINGPPARTDDDDHVTLHFFRPLDGKTHTTRHAVSPDYRPERFVGMSPDGWLVFVNSSRELRALNPVTGARMRLPRLRTIPKGYSKWCDKVVMSSPRDGGPGRPFFVAFLRNRSQKGAVAFAGAGDKEWSLLDTSMLREVYDLAYHDGSFYVHGWMKGQAAHKVAGVKLQPEIVVIGHQVSQLKFGYCLVPSASGHDLLQVSDSNDGKYEFHRLELSRGGDGRRVIRYVPLGDLGDQAMLLGSQSSMLLSTVQVPQLMKNCVYDHVYSRSIQITHLDSWMGEHLRLRRCIEAAWFMPGLL